MAAVLCAGCVGVPDDDTEPAFENTCPGGLTRPISVHTLIEVARAHGISLARNPDCYAYIGDVDAASNGVTTDDYERNAGSEGYVLCSLEDDPDGRLEGVGQVKHPGDEETRLGVGNVRCTIYPKAAGQVARLRRALEAVAREPIERRACPAGEPSPVGINALVQAARRQGIVLLRDRRCIAPGVVAQASNVLPYANDFAQAASTEEEQGRVTCLLRPATEPTASEIQEAKATVTTQFRYRNVECWITPLPDTNESQIAALRAAFDEMSKRS